MLAIAIHNKYDLKDLTHHVQVHPIMHNEIKQDKSLMVSIKESLNELLVKATGEAKVTGKIKQVFLDAAGTDKEIATQFVKFLCSEQYLKLMTLPPENDLSKLFQELEHSLSSCDAIITFYSDAPLNWLMQRLRYYQVIRAKYKKDNLVIYVCSPKDAPDNLPTYVHWKQIRVNKTTLRWN